MLTFIAGTRPEYRKLRAIARECTRVGLPWQVLHTGQHTTLLDGLDHDPDFHGRIDLGRPASGDPLAYRDGLVEPLQNHLVAHRASAVVVQGDTASASAGGLAGWLCGLPVCHVEAGVRTHDLTQPWPEEGFRVQIAQMANWHYAATEQNRLNLLAEGIPADRILVTGNPGQDMLRDLLAQHPVPFQPVKRVLVTLHRRESFGEPLTRIVSGLLAACHQHPGFEFVWPVHPNPAIRQSLPAHPPLNLLLVPPIAPDVFTQMLSTSWAVLTDSGGVQEEAAFLGVPCLVARDQTDRPESVEAGVARLVGTDTEAVRQGLTDAILGTIPASPQSCFGDGHSAPRIVAHLKHVTVG